MNQKVKELTISSLFLGVVIGVIMTAANVYLGLYAGMTVSASIPAAVIATGVYKLFFKNYTIYQTNIVQTMASAGESLAAGVIFTLPALVIVGAWNDFEFWPTTFIAMAGGLLGVIFMIPLRKALIVEEKNLIYPEGVACASVLESSVANTEDESAKQGLMTIIQGLLVGGLFKFFIGGKKLMQSSVEFATKSGESTWFTGFDISAALLSVGYIVKLEVAVLVFIGGFIGFNIAIPMLGSTSEQMLSMTAIDQAWALWSSQVRYLGVGAMIVGGVWSIFSVRSGISAGLAGLGESYKVKNKSQERTQTDMPLVSMMILFLICFVMVFSLYQYLIGEFGISLLTTLLMIFCSFLFVAVSSYIVGLVGSSNNPVSGMTISALLVSAALFLVLGFEGESAILATLGVAAVVCCAACTAGDCSQDLKTGSLIGATPKYQQYAQVVGVVIPAFVIAPVLSLLHETQGIGVGLKAPQATLFASITNALFSDAALPVNMVLIGGIFGALILIIDNIFLKKSKFRLHLMPMAVGIYLPITLATPILIGGVIRFIIERKRSAQDDSHDKGVLLSSGFIAGEAIMGVILAIIASVGFSFSDVEINASLREFVSLAGLIFLASLLYKTAKS